MKKDASVIKILSILGLRNDPILTPDQEQELKTAIDPELQYLNAVHHLFTPKNPNTK
jgi:hypothetical protein